MLFIKKELFTHLYLIGTALRDLKLLLSWWHLKDMMKQLNYWKKYLIMGKSNANIVRIILRLNPLF